MAVKKIPEIPADELSNILKQGAMLRLPYKVINIISKNLK